MPTEPFQLFRAGKELEAGDAYKFTVKFVDLVRFQAGAAVHLGMDHALILRRVPPCDP